MQGQSNFCLLSKHKKSLKITSHFFTVVNIFKRGWFKSYEIVVEYQKNFFFMTDPPIDNF